MKASGLVEITTWVPDDLAEALDQLVRDGRFKSKREAYSAALTLGSRAS